MEINNENKMIRKHTLETSVIIALIILSLLFYGCGTRKSQTEKKSTDTESINVVNSSIETTKIVLGTNFKYTPFDGLKPMIIDGKVFENAIVSGGNFKEISNTKTFVKKYDIVKTITIEKSKSTERKDNTVLYLGLFFISISAIFFYLKLKT